MNAIKYKKLIWLLSALIVSLYAVTAVGGQEISISDGGSGRIVGGEEATPGEFPWITSIQYYGGHFCGGSLIASDWVLTASHCAAAIPSTTGLTVVVGRHALSSADGQTRSVEQIIMHPSYSSSTLDYDVALLKLSAPINGVETIGLVSAESDIDDPGIESIVAGWGTLSSGGSSPDKLQKVTVPVVSTTICNQSYGGAITARMICAGFQAGGLDACQGDSGGPMMVADGNELAQSGIVSWGYGCAAAGFYGVYTRVSSVKSWIESEMAAVEPTPTPSPTIVPTVEPTPTIVPTVEPTPTIVPTVEPTPTIVPTVEPTPTIVPTVEPTATTEPTVEPTPTIMPTVEPTATTEPTVEPTLTIMPTVEPTPTTEPTVEPTPTIEPTVEPTPTIEPTVEPTPTIEPTVEPTPTTAPTVEPTPTTEPTVEPTLTMVPTAQPTETPSPEPTIVPTVSIEMTGTPEPVTYVELIGEVESISAEIYIINGEAYALTVDTQIEGDPAIGDSAYIFAERSENGITALNISAWEMAENFELEGVIEAFDDASLTIDGKVISITEVTDIQGTLMVGADAFVKGSTQNGGMTADTIRVRSQDAGEIAFVEVLGSVSSLSDAEIIVGSSAYLIDENTEMAGSVQVGNSVWMLGLDKGEQRVALYIVVLDEASNEGTVDGLSADSITVDGVRYRINSNTRILDSVKVGDRVYVGTAGVRADQEALLIRMQAVPTALAFSGVGAASVQAGSLILSSAAVALIVMTRHAYLKER